MKLFTIAGLWVSLSLALSLAVELPSPAWLPPAANQLLALAATNNPQIIAMRAEQQAAELDAEALDGFFTPSFTAAAGGGEGPASAPAATLMPNFGGDLVGVQAGLLIPLRSGAYLGAGAAQRYLFRADGFKDLGQTVAGLRLTVPLLQDRGFRDHYLNQEAQDKTALMAHAARRALELDIARHTLASYAGLLYATADVKASQQALARVAGLLKETEGRIQLETVAAYQAHGARMEVGFREDELRRSQLTLARARENLKAILDLDSLSQFEITAPLLRDWALFCADQDDTAIAAQGAPRPELRQAQLAVEIEETLTQAAREKLRSQLSFDAGLGYSAENRDGGFGTDSLLSDDKVGYELSLVWRRPLSFDPESARVKAQESRLAARRSTLNYIRLQLADEQAQARHATAAARERLRLVDRAVTEARLALAAEEERLSLGEGRNRNVLDAQKDLTDAERRANLAAYDMIIAFTELLATASVPLIP